MMKSLDIAFLCEHWLIESEIVRICDDVFKPYCVHMKSSMTNEDLTTVGRPYGGVGFVRKLKAGFTYDEIKCDSDRVLGLDVSYNACKVLTVYGVYTLYNNGTASQTELYIDTLNRLSAIIEESSGQAPYLVLGDMNTELSNKATLNKNLYKQKPFNCHSGAKTIKKYTNSTENKPQTHRAKQYEVTSFLSTDCELSTETCSKNVYSLGPWSSI